MDEPNEPNDQDIEVAQRYLKLHDPKHATRDDAIALLKDLRAGFHSMAHHDPEQLLKLQQDLDEDKRS
jgi:hypothetical protein